MREIKFRAWLPGNVMCDWDDLSIGIPEGGFDNDECEELRPHIHLAQVFEDWERQGVKLMQYTGIKDKNGKDIYEGDIIKEIGVLLVVTWSNSYNQFRLSKPRGGKPYRAINRPFKLYTNSCNFTEVIGNIYENPDLLK